MEKNQPVAMPQNGDIVVRGDRHGQVLFINEAAEAYFSITNTVLKSCDLKGWLTHKKGMTRLLAAYKDVFSSKHTLQTCEQEWPEGTVFQWSVARDDQTQEIQIIGKKSVTAQDPVIGQDYDSLQRLFECLQETMPINYWWKDKAGFYRGMNSNVVNMVGLKPEELIGKRDVDLPWTTDVDALVRNDNEVMRTGQPQKMEEVLIGKDGKPYTFLVMKSPLRNNKGEIIGTVGTSFDITDRKKAEEALRCAKEEAEAANQAKTEFLENMRHDIRTPLTGIVGFAQIIRDEAPNVRIKEYADNLVASSQSLMEFLNEILETIRMTTGEIPLFRKKFNLKEKLEDVLHLVRAKASLKKLNLTLNYDETIPQYLVGDSKRIHRIVLELVTNALNFTDTGSVTLGAALAKRSGDDLVLKITVKDTGIGISPEQQENIFARFKRLTPSYEGVYKGMGLGLSVVKQFIDDLGAEIYVESKLQEGATFTCLFRLKEALLDDDFGVDPTPRREIATQPSTVRTPELPYGELDQTKTCVLIVEDQHIAAQVAKSILEGLHCAVDIASTGQEALQKANERIYDLIFMDVGLPDMDGCRVAKQMRLKEWSRDKHVPILALTAHIDSENKQRCITAGMDAVLSKPLSRDKAADLLNAFIPERASKIEKQEEKPAVANTDQALLKLEGPVLDLKAGMQLLGGQKEVVLEMLKMLVESFDEELLALKTAHDAQDWGAISDWAHKMKGGACYCGTLRLRQACERLEDYVRAQKTEILEGLYEQMIVEVEAVRQAFRKKM